MNISLEEWLSYVHNLPYFERRLEIARMSPRTNRFLYKYMSCEPNDEELIDRVRDILVKSRLWLSSPVDFNDPFDMSTTIVVSDNPRERRKRFDDLLKEKGVPYPEREKKVKSLVKKPTHELGTLLTASFQKNIEKVGVFSFAGKARNILMWSHYAKYHTGICIQFELAQDFGTLGSAVPIEYSEVYPETTWANNFPETLSKALLQKHKGWEYEREYRIIRPGQARTYLPINPQAVAGIIMGCRTSPEHRETIEELLEERRRAQLLPVKLFFVQQHKSRYQLSVFREANSD